MSYRVDTSGPRVVERGKAATLSVDVYDATNTRQTATAGTVRILVGARELLATTAATSLGPPASYSLSAGATEDEALTDGWLEIWSLTIGGVVETFTIAGHLARYPFRPTVTEADLEARHASLTHLRPPGETDWSRPLELARQRLERDLIKKGRRPWLIFDAWALEDALAALVLHYIFRDAASAIENPAYQREAAAYKREYSEELAAVNFRWDTAETGTVDSGQRESARSAIALTAGPVRYRVRS